MLTETRRLILETRLSEAEDAWHRLNTGRFASVYVDQNGERVEYRPANSMALRAYILQLKSELAGVPPASSCFDIVIS